MNAPCFNSKTPRALPQGGTIAVVSPAFATPDITDFDRGEAWLTALGYQIHRFPSATAQWRYLAGTDSERAADLMAALTDPTIDAVWCARGGYGCQRLLAHLDWEALAQVPPKPVIGFSDITVLHVALYQILGWRTFYGPMITSNLAELPDTPLTPTPSTAHPYTLQCCLDVITGQTTFPYTIPNQDAYQCLHPLSAPQGETLSAPLVGGNLTLLAALCGTPYQLNARGHLLFIEDWKEAFYSLDRQFQQLKQAGVFQGITGLLLCDFSQSEPQGGIQLPELLTELTEDLGVPVGYGFSVGHGEVTATLPIGATVQWHPATGQLILPAPAVQA